MHNILQHLQTKYEKHKQSSVKDTIKLQLYGEKPYTENKNFHYKTVDQVKF